MKGWIYVAFIKGTDQLKIGFTTKCDPEDRLSEQSRSTGVPGRLKMVYAANVKSPRAVERVVHNHLRSYRLPKKEWFVVDHDMAINAIRSAAGDDIFSERWGESPREGICETEHQPANGRGTHTFADGSEFDGRLKNGKMHGKGIYTAPDGSSYDGQFKKGKKHGTGTYAWPDGSMFDGHWKDDRRHGSGMYVDSSGLGTTQRWKNGKREGKSIVTEHGFFGEKKYVEKWKDGALIGRRRKLLS